MAAGPRGPRGLTRCTPSLALEVKGASARRTENIRVSSLTACQTSKARPRPAKSPNATVSSVSRPRLPTAHQHCAAGTDSPSNDGEPQKPPLLPGDDPSGSLEEMGVHCFSQMAPGPGSGLRGYSLSSPQLLLALRASYLPVKHPAAFLDQWLPGKAWRGQAGLPPLHPQLRI